MNTDCSEPAQLSACICAHLRLNFPSQMKRTSRKPAVVFHNGTVVLPNAVVVCEGGCNTRVSRTRKRPQGATLVDAKGGYIAPGFVDVHVHGGDGADFMDGTVPAVRNACRAHVRHGTTTIFPTTTTGSPEQLGAMLAACVELQRGGTAADGAR